MNILYVEDSWDMGVVCKKVLEDKGHTVTWVQHRADLPEDFTGFDFVLSDFEVPGGDFNHTQKKCAECQIPLLLVSGSQDVQGIHPHFLPKPFDFDKLADAIEHVLESVS